MLSPIVLASKRDGNFRFYLDFRSLNTQIQEESFPLMTPQEAMMELKNSKYFSVIDICSAFNQIPLSEESRYLTGFQTTLGVYQFERSTVSFSESYAHGFRRIRFSECACLFR